MNHFGQYPRNSGVRLNETIAVHTPNENTETFSTETNGNLLLVSETIPITRRYSKIVFASLGIGVLLDIESHMARPAPANTINHRVVDRFGSPIPLLIINRNARIE